MSRGHVPLRLHQLQVFQPQPAHKLNVLFYVVRSLILQQLLNALLLGASLVQLRRCYCLVLLSLE